MEPLKNMFNKKAVDKISKEIKSNYKSFDDKNFKKDIFKELDHLELKQRTHHIAVTLHDYLPSDFKKSAKIIVKTLADESKKDDANWDRHTNKGIVGFLVWPLNEYVEIYGIKDYETSMWAMYELTKRFTSEFTVRPFIEEYDERVYKDLRRWIKDPNRHVRRWISEGTRPTLPWAMNVKKIHNNIPRNIPILKALFQDKEEYVRRSVANHLNDISKLDKKLMLQTCKDFLKVDSSKETQWIVKHATRTLLKKGDKQALVLNGYVKDPKVKLKAFKLSKKQIKEGDRFDLSFKLESTKKLKQNLLIEYIIHFPKKNGKLSAKAFRLKDFSLAGGDSIEVLKSVHFKKISTRKHYSGMHLVEIQVNGEVLGRAKIKLSI